MDAKAADSFRARNLSANLIGRRKINIPEIILGVHGWFNAFHCNFLAKQECSKK